MISHPENIAVVEEKDKYAACKELNEVLLGEDLTGKEKAQEAAEARIKAITEEQLQEFDTKKPTDHNDDNGKHKHRHEDGPYLEQPSVQQAVKAAHSLKALERHSVEEKAQHMTSGGRW